MNRSKLLLVGAAVVLLALNQQTTAGQSKSQPQATAAPKAESVSADRALVGVPLDLSPDQLPNQFRTQLRGDVKSSEGLAVLRQKGKDVEYTFAWRGMTSPVISGHFHKAPQGQVGVRAYPICGVTNESPACPGGNRNSISGVWKNADIDAFERGQITVAFHTKSYPAPIGEIAVYIPAKR